jgi:predicted chitinase
MKFIFALLLFSFCCNAEQERFVHKDIMSFLNALHKVETSGKLGAIKGDNGNALGPFQIWKGYYKDAVEKSKGKLNKNYSHVSDIKYAREVVLWYFYRYAPKALENGDWEKLARIHNGGPNGYNKKQTIKYWIKVKKHLK